MYIFCTTTVYIYYFQPYQQFYIFIYAFCLKSEPTTVKQPAAKDEKIRVWTKTFSQKYSEK